jgi:hypothetical protein
MSFPTKSNLRILKAIIKVKAPLLKEIHNISLLSLEELPMLSKTNPVK